MGKDSLLKSTSKKKGPAKKKTAGGAKKAADRTTAKKAAKAPAKKNPAKKSEPKKQPPAVKTPVAAKKVDGKPAAPPVEISVRELLKEKFERYAPATLFAPETEKLDPQRLISPPFIDTEDPAETRRLKALLLEKFDLAEMAAAARAAAPAAEPSAAAAASPVPPAEPAAPAETPTPPPLPTGDVPPETPVDRDALEGFGGPMPYSKTTIMGIVAFAMLVLLILGASFSNTHKYYLEPGDGGLEVWRGAFAPMGREKLLTLPGVQPPAETREVYAKDEVYPLVFDYYLGQADGLLGQPGLPDFEAIKTHLVEARKFASTPEAEKMARLRIDYIDLFVLRYKAEIAAAKGTPAELDAALGYLSDASRLAIDPAESDEIAKRIELFREQKARLLEEQAARQAEIEAAEEAARSAQAAATGGTEEGNPPPDAATPGEGGSAEAPPPAAHGQSD
jgi:hypothetical protein